MFPVPPALQPRNLPDGGNHKAMPDVEIGIAPVQPRIAGRQVAQVSDSVGSSTGAVGKCGAQIVCGMSVGIVGGQAQPLL
jgi:hypothetical protein